LEYGQSISRTMTAQFVHEVNEHKIMALRMSIILPVATHEYYTSLIKVDNTITSNP